MRVHLLLVVACAVIAIALAADSDVVDLTAAGVFDKETADGKGWLIEFVEQGRVYAYNGDRSEEDLVRFATAASRDTASARTLPAGTAPAAADGGSGGDSDVIVLTSSDFDRRVKQEGGKWLVEFYAPWCGYCKQLAPIYERVATALAGQVNVAKVDASESADVMLGRRFGVRGFPTIKFIYNGTAVYDYTGDRTVDAMTQWARDTDWTQQTPAAQYPGPRSMIHEVIDAYAEIGRLFQRYYVQWFWVAVPLTFAFGLIAGIAMCRGGAPVRRVYRQQSVVVQYAPIATSAPSGPASLAAAAKGGKHD